MVERKRIGIAYAYNEGWIGGTYYMENLIHALNALDDNEKPHIVLLMTNSKTYNKAKKKFNYPYLSFQCVSGETNLLFKFLNKITRRLIGKTFFKQTIPDLDAVFPYYECIQQSIAKKKIYWIADFQEHFVPEFYDQQSLKAMKTRQLIIKASAENLVLSSKASLSNFQEIYPDYKVKVSVLNFAVTHPGFQHLGMADLLNKFSLPEHYFICPNQFWKHKNHLVVLKALKILKDSGVEVAIAFTGNTKDHRDPDYFMSLMQYVTQNDMEGSCKFLGFIDRQEQLQLMNNSLAIIQPSLFEGWSTVVEDAKSMNKFIIVSDISVHREQLSNTSALFFCPNDENQLSIAISNVLLEAPMSNLYMGDDYKKNVISFAKHFLAVLND